MLTCLISSLVIGTFSRINAASLSCGVTFFATGLGFFYHADIQSLPFKLCALLRRKLRYGSSGYDSWYPTVTEHFCKPYLSSLLNRCPSIFTSFTPDISINVFAWWLIRDVILEEALLRGCCIYMHRCRFRFGCCRHI